MVNKYMGLLILNEKEDNIMSLTKNRPLASIPFAGRYRIIDFALSNLVNFRVNNVGIITQSNSRSLIDHLGSGSHWDLDRKRSGIFVFNFSSYTNDINDAKILMDNLEYLYRSKEEYVIVSSSYMICNINYEEAAKFHEESNADITVISTKTGNGKKEYLGCDALNVDENNKVLSVGKNYGGHNDLNISMEMYLMKKDILIDLLYKTVETGYYSSIKEAINKNISNINIKNFEFKGYVKCINSIDAFYKANMDMLNLEKSRELFFKNGLIMTKVMDEAPAKYTDTSKVSNSLIANGCIIEGEVSNSIIFRRVKVQKGAVINNSIIMQNGTVKENAVLNHVIIDKNVIIEKEKELKGDKDFPLVIEKRLLYLEK